MNYPFSDLAEGQTFTVPCDSVNEPEFINVVAQAGIKLSMSFTCVRNEDNFEVGRPAATSNYSIVSSSPKMQGAKSAKYPFAELAVGTSFTLPIVGTNEGSLRVQCNIYGKKLSRVFKCIKHKDGGLLEVGRIS